MLRGTDLKLIKETRRLRNADQKEESGRNEDARLAHR